MANFQVGQRFSSFLEFEKHLSAYENENFVKFYRRDCRKIETAIRARRRKAELNPELIYYSVKFSCVRGGTFQQQRERKRKTSSYKIDCPAHIALLATRDGKALEVKSFVDGHNHEISKVFFDNLPQQRRLSESYKNKARELLKLPVSKKLIQQILQEETGKVIKLKDLYNLAKVKEVKSSPNELYKVVSLLQEKYNNTLVVAENDQEISEMVEVINDQSMTNTECRNNIEERLEDASDNDVYSCDDTSSMDTAVLSQREKDTPKKSPNKKTEYITGPALNNEGNNTLTAGCSFITPDKKGRKLRQKESQSPSSTKATQSLIENTELRKKFFLEKQEWEREKIMMLREKHSLEMTLLNEQIKMYQVLTEKIEKDELPLCLNYK